MYKTAGVVVAAMGLIASSIAGANYALADPPCEVGGEAPFVNCWTDSASDQEIKMTAPITISSRLVSTNGKSRTIDLNGKALTVVGGINVTGSDSLAVVDSEGGGTLDVPSVAFYQAGIGGNETQDGGSVSINGGTVNVVSGIFGAAIGGGYTSPGDGGVGGSGGTLTVTGGTVNASSGSSAAAIGGGFGQSAGGTGANVTITGGTVNATAAGGDNGAGIGGAYGGSGNPGGAGGTVVITGGTVNATGGTYGAGIGGARGATVGGAGGSVTISGGTVTAIGGSSAAGIGGGSGNSSGGAGGAVAVSGGTVKAIGGGGTPVSAGPGIGGGSSSGAAPDPGTLSVGAVQGPDTTQTDGGVGGSNSAAPSITFGSPPAIATVTPVTSPAPPANAGSAQIVVTSVPVPPTITTITPGNKSLTVAFDDPISDGGAAITNYQYSTDSGITWLAMAPAKTTSPLTITKQSTAGNHDLVNGTSYTIRLRAVNSIGPGQQSEPVAGIPDGSSPTPSPTPTPATKENQSLKAGAAPKKIKFRGTTVLNKRNAKTKQSRPLTAKVRVTVPRGEVTCARIAKGKQRMLSIRTTGKCKLRVAVTYTAPGNAKYKAFKQVKTYNVRR